jgi:glucose 1-dehydrogenase
MEIRLSGKRTLITGASSGIGRAIAEAAAAAGARVAINYRSRPEDAQEVVSQVRAGGAEALALAADVADPAQVARMFEDLDRAWGGIDILVNNAGIDGDRALAWEIRPEAWRRVLDVNLVGAYHCARSAMQRMVSQGSGVILNITSVHEVIPWTGYSAYAASKAGVSMLTKTLAQEGAPRGIRVLAVAPGAIQTPINRDVWGNPASLADLLTKIPMGRVGQTHEVAQMVVILVSDAASYVAGTTVFVDGGMTLYPEFSHGG